MNDKGIFQVTNTPVILNQPLHSAIYSPARTLLLHQPRLECESSYESINSTLGTFA